MAFNHPATSFYLDDGTTAYAPAGGGLQTVYGHVGGSARVYDFGTTQWVGFAAFEPAVLDMSSGNETYTLIIEGNTAADFSGASHDLGTWNLRALNPQDAVVVDTLYDAVVYRYGRLKLVVTGTTPQIRLVAFLKSLADSDNYTLNEQITANVTILQNLSNAGQMLRDWSSGLPWGGAGHDGRYPLVDGSGNTLIVKSPAQIIAEANAAGPEFYGAIGDGNSHKAGDYFATLEDLQARYPFAVSLNQEMDYLGWQAAFNAGGRVLARKATYIMMNADGDPQVPLKLVADGSVWTEGYGSVMDFSALTPVMAETWFKSNYAFSPSTGWVNASIYDDDQLTDAIFTTGQATYTDPATWEGAHGNFCQFGTLYDLEAGNYEVVLEGEATLGASKAAGNFNPPYAGVTFFSDSPGEGDNLSGASGGGGVAIDGDTPVPFRFSYVFSLAEAASGWLTFTGGGYANFKVTKLGVKKHVLNCAIWATRDGADDHYPLQMPFKGIRLEGPGRSVPGARGIYIHSYDEIDGNCTNYEDVRIAGFESAVEFGNGAYLVEFTRVNIISCRKGYYFPEGLQNAGENFRLHGGGVSSCDILIHNPGGAEFSLFGSLLDYADTDTENNGQIIVGGGRIELHSVHCETRTNTVVGKPLFDIDGTVTWFGGMILIAPNDSGAVEALIKLNNSNATMRFHETDLYNLQSQTGFIASGPGQIIGRMRNNGQPNLSLISDSPAMDVLGGAGLMLDEGRIDLEGGAYSTYNNATMLDQWNNTDQSVSWSDDHAMGAGNCLKVTKHYGVGAGAQIQILVPITALGNVFGTIEFLFPNAVGTGTAPLYFRLFWVRSRGIDVLGRPVLAYGAHFKGEANIDVPLAGSMTPVSRGLTATYAPGITENVESNASGAPLWATHLAAWIDTQSLPAMTFYIGNIKANVQ